MIQVKQTTRPSVIPAIRHVRPYVSHVNCSSVIPQTQHVHPYVSLLFYQSIDDKGRVKSGCSIKKLYIYLSLTKECWVCIRECSE